MRLRTFSSIGGLRILGGEPGKAKDILELRVDRQDLNTLALGLLQEIRMDASPDLISWMRQMVECHDEVKPDEEVAIGLTEEQQRFIKSCEDNAGENKREGETTDQYLRRLWDDYGTDYLSIPARSRVRRSD